MAENPLGELILDAMRVQRIAFRTVAARAAEAGLPLSHSAIQRMARKPLELLSRDVVTALSAGLNINEDAVLSAALDTIGMHSPVPPMPTVREALLQDSALSLPSKNALLAPYEAFASLPVPMPVGTVLSPQVAA